MKTVKLGRFGDGEEGFIIIGTISYDGKKMTGDSVSARNVLSQPVRSYRSRPGRERFVTADEGPEEFLRSLSRAYRSAYFMAGEG